MKKSRIMNRRDFLKSLCNVGVASLLPLGVMKWLVAEHPNAQNITILPKENPKELRLGWVVYEDVGFGVINDHAISKILVG